MAFQIKDFASIVASQINHARSVTTKLTDFQPGGVARTIMEAPAVEIEELYLQMFLGLRDAIPVATFLSFGFDKLPASVAHGFVSISRDPAPTAPIQIPEGTEFTATDGRVYLSTADVTWAAGAPMVKVPVAFGSAGLAGNISQGLITSSAAFTDAFVVSNSAISTGRDIESESEREARFSEFIKSLSRGTVQACLYAVGLARVLDADGNLYEYVTRTGLDEQPGHVRIYAYSSRGIPSSDLIAAGQMIIDGSRDEATGVITPGYRAAGVRVDVLPMVERAVPLSIKVDMLPGYSMTSSVIQQLSDIFDAAIRSVQPGTVLYLGTLVELLLAAAGVQAIVPQSNENIICAEDEALIPGALSVSAL